METPEHFTPGSRKEWRDWLRHNHHRPEGVWLVTFKKYSGRSHLPYADAVEEALCFGWIDSKPGKVDNLRSKLWFAPRKAGTGWSKPNKDRILRMTEAGQMQATGLKKVEAAQADGSWTKLDAIEALVIPPDLTKALVACPPAAENFEAFPRSIKRGILEWILQAKKPETRARRIDETATLAAQNRRANQWRGA